jgi:type I restriction enzyme M protein
MPRLTQQQLEAHLWGAANILRGRTAGQDYKTYILSLMFFKRLGDQWDFEADDKIEQLERDRGRPFTDAQRQALRSRGDLHRFTIPASCHWSDVVKASENVGEVLTTAMRGVANANKELLGVFTVDWNQPAPDGKGKLLANEIVSALVQHFHSVNLSNANVQPDVLGRAYEYLIKQFADDAGAKAGEFFTPPEVVDLLIRILEPQPGEAVYDPTCGSGGMLIHSADFLAENGHNLDQLRYYGQELNWSTYAIARINVILHGLEADIRGGKSTITDPQFLRPDGSVDRFDLVIANFPFSQEFWWLTPEKRAAADTASAQASQGKRKTPEKPKMPKDYKDPFGRFVYGKPPAGYGDYAFIQHIVASTNDTGRAGVVCPQGVLFRGQPEVEEETGEFDADGKPIVRRRKADDEYLIRKGLLDARLIDAVIALPLNIFYGAGVPACLLILNRRRPKERRDKLLLVYAARHYRELSNKNQLRPQDVMRILVHYHAYGDAAKAARLVKLQGNRLQEVIDRDEAEEVARITAEHQPTADKLAAAEADLADAEKALAAAAGKAERTRVEKRIAQLTRTAERLRKNLAERDERIAEAKKRAAEERQAIEAVGRELIAVYADPAELGKHARVVDLAEVEENEHNLNIPRYVDTFEPEEPIDVNQALAELEEADTARQTAERQLRKLLKGVGYAG